MVSDDDVEWLSGLSDAEACFHIGMNKLRRDNVVVAFQIGLVRHDVVEEARGLIERIVGEPVPEIHVRPATATQREFYSITVAAKRSALTIIETLSSRLHGKRAEALAAVDILRRASGGHHTATERDRELCELSRRVKNGDLAAKERVMELLSAPPTSNTPTTAWLAGLLDGDGSVSIIREARGDACYHTTNVNISSSDRPAIESLRGVVARTYGVTAMATKKATAGSRPNHSFNIATDDIERFLTALRPHLRVKAAETDVMLDVCRGKTGRERACDILRAMKQDDDPGALLERFSAGERPTAEPKRKSRMEQYRRPTYGEMEKRGLWSSEEARAQLGGIGHAAWVTVTEGLVPDDRIGNKKYFAPTSLRAHVTARLAAVVRSDARERMRQAMERWGPPLALPPAPR